MPNVSGGSVFADVSFWVGIAICIISSYSAYVIKSLTKSVDSLWKRYNDLSHQLDILQGEHNVHKERHK